MTYKENRDKAFYASYRKLLHDGVISHKMFTHAMMTIVINSPAPSFFIDVGTIIHHISMYRNGYKFRRRATADLSRDLYAAFTRLCKENPALPKNEIYVMLLYEPAPRYYIDAATARRIIFG